jgi:hypothetical protein
VLSGTQFTCFSWYKITLLVQWYSFLVKVLSLLGGAGTQFTCFTGTKEYVTLLTDAQHLCCKQLSLLAFTGTEVQILTQQACVLVTLMRNICAVSNGLKQTICSGLRSSILTYAGVCWRMLAHAGVCWRILAYAGVC